MEGGSNYELTSDGRERQCMYVCFIYLLHYTRPREKQKDTQHSGWQASWTLAPIYTYKYPFITNAEKKRIYSVKKKDEKRWKEKRKNR